MNNTITVVNDEKEPDHSDEFNKAITWLNEEQVEVIGSMVIRSANDWGRPLFPEYTFQIKEAKHSIENVFRLTDWNKNPNTKINKENLLEIRDNIYEIQKILFTPGHLMKSLFPTQDSFKDKKDTDESYTICEITDHRTKYSKTLPANWEDLEVAMIKECIFIKKEQLPEESNSDRKYEYKLNYAKIAQICGFENQD